MSSGGYHHHVGANVWHSEGASPRDPERAGLAWYSLEASGAATIDTIGERVRAAGAPLDRIARGIETADPWGTRIRLVAP
jgi:catechol 2,3-dioxygenase